ncbi:MAG: hypothetical protein AAF740_10500, partial [Bacteroidota bacterium]
MSVHYKIKEQQRDRWVFKEASKLWIFVLVFGVIGGGMLSFGLASFFGDVDSSPPSELGFVFTSFGLIFSSAALLMFTVRFANPSEIIFDNALQKVIIKQKTRDSQHAAAIPYTDIASFGIRTKVTSSSSSSGGSSTTTTYIVHWQKTDSSIWDLSAFSNPKKAEKLLDELENFFSRKENAGNERMQVRFPKLIKKTVFQDQVDLTWRNRITWKVIFFVSILFGFWLITPATAQSENYLALVIMSLVLLAITAGLGYYVWQSFFIEHGIRITKEKLSELRNGQEKKSLPLSEIAAINFDFKDAVGGSPLRVMTRKQQQDLSPSGDQKMDIKEVSKLFTSAFKLFQINIEGLDVVEKIHL